MIKKKIISKNHRKRYPSITIVTWCIQIAADNGEFSPEGDQKSILGLYRKLKEKKCSAGMESAWHLQMP